MKKLNLVILMLCNLLIISCDPAVGLNYIINNKSENIIIVKYYGSGMNPINDTTILIQPKTKNMIYETSIWGRKRKDLKEKFLTVFDSLKITTSDLKTLKKDYYKRDNWDYTNKHGKNDYEFEINDIDINK